MNYHLILLFALLSLFVFNACNDASVIGLEVVENEQVDIQVKEDIPLILSTIPGDSLQVFSPILRLNNYFCGEMTDPIFGNTSASIFSELALGVNRPSFAQSSLGFEVRAIYLLLPYRADAVYGDTTETYSIEVFRVRERMNRNTTYFSDQTFQILEERPLGELTFQPRPLTRNSTYLASISQTASVNYLQVPLTDAFGNLLLQLDTTTYSNDSTFIDFFNGLHIRMKTPTNGMLSFNLNDLNAGVHMIYDTIAPFDLDASRTRDYFFPFTSSRGVRTAKLVNFKHNYNGTPVQAALEGEGSKQELAFLQGMTGTNIKVVFPNIADLKGLVVNQAILELPVVELPNSKSDIFTPSEQIIAFKKVSEREAILFNQLIPFRGFRLIDDFELAARASTNVGRIFGGNLITKSSNSSQVYAINISSIFQKMIDGEVANEIILQAAPPADIEFIFAQELSKLDRASRTIIGTPNHQKNKAKLILVFTKL
jgi:hypothetical protein